MIESCWILWCSEGLKRKSGFYTAWVAGNYQVNLNALAIHHTLVCTKCETYFLCFLHVCHRNGNRTRGGGTQWVVHSTSDAHTSLQYCDLPESTTTYKSRPGLGEGGSEWKKGCFMERKSFPSVQNRRTLGSLSKPMLALGCAEFSFFFFSSNSEF